MSRVKRSVYAVVTSLITFNGLPSHSVGLKDRVLLENNLEKNSMSSDKLVSNQNKCVMKNSESSYNSTFLSIALALALAGASAHGFYKYSDGIKKTKAVDKFNDEESEAYGVNESLHEDSINNYHQEKYRGESYAYKSYELSNDLLDKAKKRYLEINSDVSADAINEYAQKFIRCYDAAVVLYNKNASNLDNYNTSALEPLIIISIVDDILKIPEIERIPRPDRQLAFYLFSKFRGNFEDIDCLMKNIEKHVPNLFPNNLKFVHLLNGSLFDHNSRSDIAGCLRNMPIRVERRENSYAFISECCIISVQPDEWNDYLELTVSDSNEKMIHYVYNSPCTRGRSCDFWYKIK